MKHEIDNDKKINDFQFVNFEDFFGVTFNRGFQSAICPGSGVE